MANDPKEISRLVAAGADVREDRSMAFRDACRHGHVEAMTILKALGADIYCVSPCYSLTLTVESDRVEAVQLFLQWGFDLKRALPSFVAVAQNKRLYAMESFLESLLPSQIAPPSSTRSAGHSLDQSVEDINAIGQPTPLEELRMPARLPLYLVPDCRISELDELSNKRALDAYWAAVNASIEEQTVYGPRAEITGERIEAFWAAVNELIGGSTALGSRAETAKEPVVAASSASCPSSTPEIADGTHD